MHLKSRASIFLKATLSTALALAVSLPVAAAWAPAAWAAQPAFVCPALDVQAQILTTGALHVVEQRTFEFQSPTDTLRWWLTGFPEESELSVSAVRMAPIDESGNVSGDWITLHETTFDSDWRNTVNDSGGSIREEAIELEDARQASGAKKDDEAVSYPEGDAWAFDSRQRGLYVFFTPAAERMVFELDYQATDAAAAYDDIAELYWDYVPARADATTENVSARLQLPVPDGAQITPGQNVLAWGHGAPGEVDISADGTVTYTVPLVQPGQYAQAHVLFPVQWLPNLSTEAKIMYSGTRLDFAKSEEAAWTDTWSNQRVNNLAGNIALTGVCALILVAAAALYLVFGRESKPENIEPASAAEVQRYEDNPELLNRFENWNHIAENEKNPQLITAEIEQAALFDARSFKLQKILAVVAVVFIAAALFSLFWLHNTLAVVEFLIVGATVGVIANYIPRRTPKGQSLALALGTQDTKDATAPEDRDAQ